MISNSNNSFFRKSLPLIILSVIDNLLKGQPGQAIQNLNIMSGFSMDDGLELTNNFP